MAEESVPLDIGAPVTPSEQDGVEPYALPMETRIMQSWDRIFGRMEQIVDGALTFTANRRAEVYVVGIREKDFDLDRLSLTIGGDRVIAGEIVALNELMEESARREDANTQGLLRDEVLAQNFDDDVLRAYLAGLDSGGAFRDLAAINFLEDSTRALVNKKADDVFQQTRAIVSQGFREGWTNERLAQEIAKMPEFGGDRSKVIARTETVRAANEGRISSFKRNEDVLNGYEHNTFFDKRTGQIDKELDGATYDLNRNPTNGIAARNSSTRIPTRANCRCAYIPILKSVEEVMSNFGTPL